MWNTHWHPDHTGGNLAIKAATGARISGPDSENIPGRDTALKEGDEVRLGNHVGRVIEVPGHTLGHIALVFDAERVAFVGDTLFAMGCGRLFEGTPQQMYASLNRLAALPGDTQLYCAHEYTLSNARFAGHAEPGNAAIADRLKAVEALRRADDHPADERRGGACNQSLRSRVELGGVRAPQDGERQLSFMNESALESCGGAQKVNLKEVEMRVISILLAVPRSHPAPPPRPNRSALPTSSGNMFSF